MLPATHRLHRRTDITHTIRRGRRASRGGLVVHYLAALPDREPIAGQPAKRDGFADSTAGHDTEGPHGDVGSPESVVAQGHVPARAAFAVGKSVGNSVVRHRVLRRLRAITLPALADLPDGATLVVRALPAAATETSAELQSDLRAALARVVGDRPPRSLPVTTEEAPAALPVMGQPQEARRTTISEIFRMGPIPSGGLARLGWAIGLPFRVILLAIVGLYRLTISPILPPTCRFHPSCSAYGLEAIQVHGPFKGVALGTWRVLRCNPWNLGGLDPVPERGHWHPHINPDGTPRWAGVDPANGSHAHS